MNCGTDIPAFSASAAIWACIWRICSGLGCCPGCSWIPPGGNPAGCAPGGGCGCAIVVVVCEVVVFCRMTIALKVAQKGTKEVVFATLKCAPNSFNFITASCPEFQVSEGPNATFTLADTVRAPAVGGSTPEASAASGSRRRVRLAPRGPHHHREEFDKLLKNFTSSQTLLLFHPTTLPTNKNRLR